MGFCLRHITSNEVEKVINWSVNLCARTLLHTDEHTFTHTSTHRYTWISKPCWQNDRISQYFASTSKTISVQQIASWMCFLYCSLKHYQNPIRYRRSKTDLTKIWIQKTFFANPSLTDRVTYFLNGSLDVINFSLKKCGSEIASTITLVLHTQRLTKWASHSCSSIPPLLFVFLNILTWLLSRNLLH